MYHYASSYPQGHLCTTILIVIRIKRLMRNLGITGGFHVCDGYYLCIHVYLITTGNLKCQKINWSCIVGKTIEFIEFLSDFQVSDHLRYFSNNHGTHTSVCESFAINVQLCICGVLCVTIKGYLITNSSVSGNCAACCRKTCFITIQLGICQGANLFGNKISRNQKMIQNE